MASSDIGMLVLVVGAFTIFGGVLAYASFKESRKGRE